MKLCNYYIETKDLKDGETKIFQCDCRRHKGRDVQVVKVDGQYWEIEPINTATSEETQDEQQ